MDFQFISLALDRAMWMTVKTSPAILKEAMAKQVSRKLEDS